MHELIALLNIIIDKFETREMEERKASRLGNHPSQRDVVLASQREQAAYTYRLLIADLVGVRTSMVEHHVDTLHALLSETVAAGVPLDRDDPNDDSAVLRLIPNGGSDD